MGLKMKCYVCGVGAVPRHGRVNVCEVHGRLLQMQHAAKADKKYVPSLWELQALIPSGMICKDCNEVMHWVDGENRQRGAVLQHYRDGSLAIVCFSCNTKHGLMPGDMYRDILRGQKLCRACKTIKPIEAFSVRKDAKKVYPVSKCKPCSHNAYVAWRIANPDKYKALNKKHNDKRKEKLNAASV